MSSMIKKRKGVPDKKLGTVRRIVIMRPETRILID